MDTWWYTKMEKHKTLVFDVLVKGSKTWQQKLYLKWACPAVIISTYHLRSLVLLSVMQNCEICSSQQRCHPSVPLSLPSYPWWLPGTQVLAPLCKHPPVYLFSSSVGHSGMSPLTHSKRRLVKPCPCTGPACRCIPIFTALQFHLSSFPQAAYPGSDSKGSFLSVVYS